MVNHWCIEFSRAYFGTFMTMFSISGDASHVVNPSGPLYVPECPPQIAIIVRDEDASPTHNTNDTTEIELN